MDFNPSVKIKTKIPEEITGVSEKLQKAGFQSYLVGGCVRDLLMGRKPKDWDITTNAKPGEIQNVFPDSVYENEFGTVGIKTESKKENLKIVEVTTFRLEGKYTDKRHPDEIKFAKTIKEDLGRRDFTINALALSMAKGLALSPTNDERPASTKASADRRTTNDGRKPSVAGHKLKIYDFYDGQKDIKDKLIRAVGDPEERFNEDALRMMRVVRLSVELGFEIEDKTKKAVKKHAGLMEIIANERIRDEFIKIIMTPRAKQGVQILEDTGLLKHVMPELREGIDVGQNKHHIYTVFEHSLLSLDYAAKKGYSLEIRLAALLHDIGKPKTKKGDGIDSTFHGHEVASARMAARTLDRLRFSKNTIEKVVHLVRYHLFYYNVGEVTEAGVRRFLRRVEPENVDDFIKLREADRIGSGVPKAVPYKIRHLLFMIEKVKHDPISPKMLKVTGNDVMEILKIQPGPRVGGILNALMDEVMENPEKNAKRNLESRVKELGKLSDSELKKLTQKAQKRKEEFEGGIEKEMKDKYYVK